MKFYFEDKTQSFKASDFERIARQVFKKLKFADKIELGLKITDNDEIKKLNQQYLKINLATDVLSFPIDLPKKNPPKTPRGNQAGPPQWPRSGLWAGAKKENLMLGDIVISVDKAKEYSRKTCLERSRENKKTVRKELIELFKHGLLHLLGYDHEKNLLQWRRAEEKIKNF